MKRLWLHRAAARLAGRMVSQRCRSARPRIAVHQVATFHASFFTRTLVAAATNRDLAAEVRAGRFREDLYFRIAAFPVRVPPLRERREEIPTLPFIERASRKLGVRLERIAEADVARLVGHSWPGNVRELEHVIKRAVLLPDPPRLRLPALEGDGVRPAPAAAKGKGAVAEWPSLEEVERRYIASVLEHVHGRVTGTGGAAEVLGLKPSTLQFRIDKLGLRDELRRSSEAGAGKVREEEGHDQILPDNPPLARLAPLSRFTLAAQDRIQAPHSRFCTDVETH